MFSNFGGSFVGGSQMAMERSYIMGDDTTLAIPKPIWEIMLPRLRELVVADSLKASPCRIEGDEDEFMSVADIGPIMGAVGQVAFWVMLRRAAAEIPYYAYNPVKVYHQVSCAFTRLSDGEDAPPESVDEHTLLHVYTPNGIDGDVPLPVDVLIPQTEHFVCLPDSPDEPVAAHYRDFLLKHSTRKKIIDRLFKLIQKHEKDLPTPNLTKLEQECAKTVVRRAKKRQDSSFKIVQAAAGTSTSLKLGHFSIRDRVFLTAPLEAREFANGLSAEFDFGKKDAAHNRVSEHADAIILGAFDANDPEQLAYNTLVLRSVVVAKATDRRYHNVPIIIQNLNGCWDAAIRSHIAYANSGYNKEFERDGVHDFLLPDEKIVSTAGVAHRALQSLDILSSNDLNALRSATLETLNFRLKGYSRVDAPPRGIDQRGERKPEGICVAAAFASASSDKLVDHKNAVEIGRILGELNMGLRTGGGDQHLMYAPIIGYSQTKRPGKSYLSCVSTHSIVQVETVEGSLPICDHYELHDTISPRLQTLMASDMYISVGGGDGTGQETGLVLREKLMFPDNAGNKLMIFVGQDPSMMEEIRSVLGSERLRQLQQDPYALANIGFFLFPDAEAARPTIEQGLREFNSRLLAERTAGIASHAVNYG